MIEDFPTFGYPTNPTSILYFPLEYVSCYLDQKLLGIHKSVLFDSGGLFLEAKAFLEAFQQKCCQHSTYLRLLCSGQHSKVTLELDTTLWRHTR